MTEEKRSWLIMFLIFLAWVVGYIDKQAINVATIAIREEMGLTASQMGVVMSSFFFTYAGMTLVGGVLADRYGAKKVLTIIMVTWSLFTVLTGMAWSFASLVAVRFMFGMSQGGFPSSTSVAIAELFPKEMRGRAKTFQISAGSMGTAVGTLVCAALTVTYGWRSTFFIFGAIGFVIVILFYKLYRPRVIDLASGEQEVIKKASFKDVLKVVTVWKLAIIQFGLGVFMWGLNSWLPSYWVNVRHLDMVTMGALSMIPWIISFFVMNFSGWFMDKYMVGRERILMCLTTSIGALFMYLMLQADNIYVAFAYLTVTTVLMGVTSAAVFVIPLKYMKREAVGTSTGICTFGQQLAGVIAPAVMGYLITAFNGSYDAVFGFVIGAVIVSCIAAFTVDTSKNIEI